MPIEPSKQSGMPKGRQTIRKGGSLTGLHGPASRPIKLWPFEPQPNTILAQLERAYFAGLDAVDRMEERTRSSATSGRFTPAGVKDDALKFALNDLVPSLHKARQTIKKAKAEAAERRSKLKLEGPDKSDAAAAVRRADIRDQLRAMKPEEQTQFFARLGDNVPPEVAMAIMEMPASLSGVPKSRYDLMRAGALQAQYGSEIAEIAELERAIAAAESAVEAGRDEVRSECGVHDVAKFNEAAAPFEKQVGPWLRKTSDGVRVLRWNADPKTGGTLQVPTPEELETGQFYADIHEYREAHGLDDAA